MLSGNNALGSPLVLYNSLEIAVLPVSVRNQARGFKLMLTSLPCGFQFIISNTVEVNRNVLTRAHTNAQW
jgi:hypothetical protein